MKTFRILLFSMLAAFALYIPFYYFAPVYRTLYVHVLGNDINWWIRWAFAGEHGGIQIYIAYVLLYLAIGLTAFFEFIYFRSIFLRWVVLGIAGTGCLFYLWFVGFFPPMAETVVNGEGVVFIAAAVITAFSASFFLDQKIVKGLFLLLLIGACIPVHWSNLTADSYYIFYPALRTIKGYALNQSYFQYDHLLSLLSMAWMKLGLSINKFFIIGNLSFLALFTGGYFLARHLFIDKRLAFYFIFSLVLIKMYGNIGDISVCPQVTPLRLDMWLIVLGLSYWRGLQDWTVGMTLGFFLVFHHSFGIMYSIAYMLMVFIILVLNSSKDAWKQYFPNACMMAGGLLINYFFIASNSSVQSADYVKYNIGFLPLGPRSMFWYIPVVMSAAVLFLWKDRTRLPERYFQTGLFLVLLAIGNLIYFFGRSHENNLINIAACPWMVFFMFMDLLFFRSSHRFAGSVKKILVPLTGTIIVGLAAFFYSGRAVDKIKEQAVNLPQIGNFFKADQPFNFDFKILKAVTHGNPDIIFMSVNDDFKYYYYGGYKPTEPYILAAELFKMDFICTFNKRLLQGADIIVPMDEYKSLLENLILLDNRYTYQVGNFVYISNKEPALN